MSGNSIYEDIDARSLIDFEDEPSDVDSLLQQDSFDNGASVAQQTAKALDAAEEGTRIPDEDDSLPPPASQSVNRVWLEHVPLRDAGPAPPDYAAATAWRKSLQPRRPNQSTDEVEEEDLYGEVRLPDSGSTHSIPPDYVDEDTHNPITFRRLISTKRASNKRRRRYFVWIVSLYIAVTLIFSVIWLVRSNYGNRYRRIAQKDHPQRTGDCQYQRYSDYARYEFHNINDFDFEYESYSEVYSDITFTRSLNVYLAPPQQKAALEVWMNVATDKPYKVAKFSALERRDGIYMRDPVFMQPDHPDARPGRLVQRRKQSCADIWMAIYIRPEAVRWLRLFADRVSTSLGYSDHQGNQGPLNATMGYIEVWTSTGNVDALYFDANRTNVYTETGRVSGTFALNNYIEFTGDSGELDITVVPKTCDASEKPCANFTVQTQLGLEGVRRPKVYPDRFLGSASNISFSTDEIYWWDDGTTNQPANYSGQLRIHPKGDGWAPWHLEE